MYISTAHFYVTHMFSFWSYYMIVQYVKVGYFFPGICGCFAERKRPNPSKIKDTKNIFMWCMYCTAK